MNLLFALTLALSGLLFSNGISVKYSEPDPDFFPPMLLSPAYGMNLQKGNVQFSWSYTGKNHVYELMTAKNPDFSDGVRYACTDTTFKTNFSETSTIIYWKVRAFKNKKTYSEWSVVSMFYIGLQPVINSGGCNGNCSACPHPCGRRRAPDYDINYIKE